MELSRRQWMQRAGVLSLGAAAGATGGLAPATAEPPPDRLRLSDYGAVPGGSDDAGPALQRALDDLGTRGGGELVVDGIYTIASAVKKDFMNQAEAVRIVGYGSASRFVLRTPGATAIQLGNLEHVAVQGITFVGSPGVRNDVLNGLAFAFCDIATLRDCHFGAVASLDNPGSVVYSSYSNLSVKDCSFRGCATKGGTVSNVDWIGFQIEHCLFLDYGASGSKTPLGGGTGWIQALAPAGYPVTGTNAQGVFTVRNVKCDEGARAVHIDPGTKRVARVHIEGLDSNVPPRLEGAFISHADEVAIEHSFFGYTLNPPVTDGIRLSDVGNALVNRTLCLQYANRITADSACGTLQVVDSTYATLASAAARTIVTKDGETTVTRSSTTTPAGSTSTTSSSTTSTTSTTPTTSTTVPAATTTTVPQETTTTTPESSTTTTAPPDTTTTVPETTTTTSVPETTTTTTTSPPPTTTTTTSPPPTTTTTSPPPPTTTTTSPPPTTTTTTAVPSPAGPPRLRSTSTGTTNSYQGSTAVSAPLPSGTMPGDVLVAFLSLPVAPAAVTAPEGWSKVRTDDNGAGLETAIFTKVAGPTEPPSYRWTFQRSNVAVIVAAVMGVDTAHPVDASSAQFANYTRTLRAPAVTTTTPNDLLLLFVGNQGGSNYTPPPSMTRAADAKSNDFYCCNVATHLAVETLTAAGDTGPRTATLDIDYVMSTVSLVAVRPPI